MVYFDKTTLAVLRYIYKSRDNGVTWGDIIDRFGERGIGIFALEALTKEGYIATQDCNGSWLTFDTLDIFRDSKFRSFTLPRGSELLETRSFNFWKWTIPTIISVVALVVSFIGVLQ